MDASLEELRRTVGTLVAHDQIRALASNYCHGLDKRDPATLKGVFAEDAVWVLGEDVQPTGHEQIVAMAVDGIWPGHELTHHWTSNHVMTVDLDAGTGTGTCDVDSTVRTAAGEWKRAAATYLDEYVRDAQGSWSISRREAVMSFLEPLS